MAAFSCLRHELSKVGLNSSNITGEPTGFQGANSFVIAHGQTLEIAINAGSGSTIHYICAIHPWMQGSIIVSNGESESDD